LENELTSELLVKVAKIVGCQNPDGGLQKDHGFCIRKGHDIKITGGQQHFPCPECGTDTVERALVFRKKARFRIEVAERRVYHYSAGGAVFCQFDGEAFRRVLLLRGTTHPVGAYSTPAGHWDIGEDAPEAAKREMWEETGIKLECLELEAEVTKQPTLLEEECRRGSDHHYWRFFIFSCRPEDSEARLRPHEEESRNIGEADMLGWIPVPQILEGRFNLIKPVGTFLSMYLGQDIPNILPR
jgi:8-oxo-dGTP pyrophosphatase MutT (NUDIX family)